MRRFLDYPKFAGRTRMMILGTQYFFDGSWVRAAESLGWETTTVSSAMVGALTRDQVAGFFTRIAEFKPDFILTSNYAGMDQQAMFSRFLEDARVPYVSWFTDTPRMILYDREIYASHYAVAATWERAYEPHFRALGFQHVFFMPLATDPVLFNGEPGDTFDRDLAFVGQSMIDEAREAWEKLRPFPRVVEAILQAFEEGRVTRERFTNGIGAVVAPEVLEGLERRDLRHVELCLIYEATRRDRFALATRLEPLGVEVRGDVHWSRVTARAGGQVGYFDDLAPFYRRTAVNLNTTSLQMRTAVNQRVFDCPAAGGFLITDAQGDLNEFFDAEAEVVTYCTLDELEEKVRYYLTRPDERRAVVERARRRVLAHHTHRNRLESLEAYLKKRYAS